MPRVLSFQDTETLAELLDCDAAALRHDALPVPKPWTGPKRRRTASASVAEVEVEAAAGPGAWHEDFVHKKARWRRPESMVRHEGDADPDALRILKVHGISMEPELRERDRLVVDTARCVPAPRASSSRSGTAPGSLSSGSGRSPRRARSSSPPHIPTARPASAAPMRSTSSERRCGRSPAPDARRGPCLPAARREAWQ